MRNKKTLRSGILMVTVMLFLSGCGNQAESASAESASAESVKTVQEESIVESMESSEVEDNSAPVESEKPDVTAEPTQTSEPAETVAPVETEEPVEKEKPADTKKPVEKEKPADTKKPVEKEKPADTKKSVEKEKPAATDKPAKPADNQAADAPSEPAQPSEPVQPSESTQPSVPAESESSGSEQPHEHNWVAHTTQRWVSQIVTVVDEPERYEKVGVAEIYWYNTGTWEVTRDPDRFTEWCYDEVGGASCPMAGWHEGNPLFLGYDESGHAQFAGDHVLYDTYDYIPAVTHEEDQGYYETYVDYYYCDCGATK